MLEVAAAVTRESGSEEEEGTEDNKGDYGTEEEGGDMLPGVELGNTGGQRDLAKAGRQNVRMLHMISLSLPPVLL